MLIAINAWFAHDELAHSGSGQYLRNLLAALPAVAPDLELEWVEPAPNARGDLSKVKFEQVDFPRAAQRMNANVAFVPHWGPPLQCACPVVVTIHDVIPLALPAYRGGPKQRAYTALVRAAAANASAILTDSTSSQQDIVKHLPVEAAHISVVPLATEPRFRPLHHADELDRVRAKYNLPERYVLYLAGFDARKNIETVLQIYGWCGDVIGEEFPLVMNATPEQAVFDSTGQRTTLYEMARVIEVQEALRLIGRVAEEDKPAVLAGARAFLFPSTYEGFGLPPLEAMACGTPVIGSNASSIPEVIGNAGILVDPMNARRMAGALIAICTEDDYHTKMRQRGLLQAAKFTWERTAFETATVLRGAGARKK
jgi:glycosyltransferase involved in cell wall biosynthesis